MVSGSMSRRDQPPSLETAESIAAQGLAFLAADSARFGRFLSLTGLTLERVRARAGTPEILAAVLEHLEGDESLLLVFAAGASVAPETVAPALAVLQQEASRTERSNDP
jgi:hypothetical protein